MKSIQHHCRWLLALLALGLLLMAKSARSEDIDIYFENSAEGVLPKVLFMVDNSSNVGSQWGAGCTGYADGSGAPSMGTTTAGGVIQCALVDAINSLPNNTLQVGLMSGNANNFGRSRGCVGSNGGCLLYPLTTINASTKPALIAFIKGWKNSNSGESETSFPFTVTNAESGGMMQEAYAYFYASTGLSGRSYAINHIAACQKNFIIYIGNTDKTPANDEPSGTALGTVATGTLRDKITKTQEFEPEICGDIESKVAGSNANDWSSNWADEWARFLLKKDGGTETQEGAQNIRTYTIGLIQNNSNQCTADYPALLQSMAVEGGGEPYRVGDAGAVKKALAEALNEVQAVNSVFSSASLPVSVNAEGSYLNQIFLGMFRPDSTGAPRWLGNLKQYQLIRNSAGNLVMGDACSEGDDCPKAAINPTTGFLSPNAISFWTYRNDAVLPDSVGGFFVNDTEVVDEAVSDGFDREDGEMVQKGGVAQQLRKQNLTATFTGAGGTTSNPRRLYSYCADRDFEGCSKDLTHSDNDFSTSNDRVSANSFGAAVSVAVRSIEREGPVATVTTASNHGLAAGSVVTIRNASQPEYNRTGPITLVAGVLNQFKMAVPDYPTALSEGAYTISVPGAAGSRSIASLSRATSALGVGQETVTVTTTDAHLYLPGQTVTINGNSATEYNRSWTIESVPAFNQFTFSVPIYPVSPPQNTYRAVHPPTSIAFSAITLANGIYTVETASVHGFHVGQTITISGVKGSERDLYNTDHVITGVSVDGRSFTIRPAGLPRSAGGGNVSPSQVAQAITLARTTTAVTGATAVVSGLPANWFANGKKVNITTTGTSPNEGAYVKNDVTITCSGSCTSFTYPIDVIPAVAGSGGSVSVPGAGTSVDVPAGAITRVGGTATVAGLTPNLFTDGSTVNISPRGTALSTESAYVNNWPITCVPNTSCSSFTFGPVTQTPALVATGSNIQAFSSNTAPDKDSMIKWLRGQDNNGDEKGPGNGVTVRPSVHGDVLHSRPLVINYGDARGIVVFYGSNDGVYRAVNGKQSGETTTGGITVPAGGEFWGLVFPEHFELINRIRANSPELKFPGTFLDSARPKDYFVDGPTGVYQKINASGVITQAIIYLTMRRGGRFLVALDVTQPAAPQFLWKIDQQTEGFAELGQTWSRPRVTLLQNYQTVVTGGVSAVTRVPVLVFGAGYDAAQDAEPPTVNTMGRGIFIVNALTGAKIFSASTSCPADTANCRKVTDMKYATPSDITFVDRDQNGFVDKFYWGDLGGNIWRADVADATVSNWSITKVAALGCNTGECLSTATPRKFFFPPAVLSIRPAGDLNSYDLLSMASGDREHPLRSDAATAAFNTNDRFFVIKDLGTSVVSTASNTSNVVPNDLFNATYTTWTGTGSGFYLSFVGGGWNETTNQADASLTATPGEKAVNAPIAVNGQIFFATNQPRQRDNTCVANLGIARGYAVDPFSGRKVRNQLEGGGMPPTAVTGLITITETKDGETKTSQEKFCIGCSVSGAQAGGTNTAPCNSALENCNLGTVVPKNLKRTYWYKK